MTLQELSPLLQTAGIVFGPMGAAWVGIRVALNGTREAVRKIERNVDRLAEDMTDVRERIARIEG